MSAVPCGPGSILSASLRPRICPRRAVPSCPGIQGPYVVARAVERLGKGRFPSCGLRGAALRAEGRAGRDSTERRPGVCACVCVCLSVCLSVCVSVDLHGCEMLLGDFRVGRFCPLVIIIPCQTHGAGCHAALKVLHLDMWGKKKLLGSSRFEFCLGLLYLALRYLEGAHKGSAFCTV